MSSPSSNLKCIPEIVLIIGTDAAGKDHVANIVERMIAEAGGRVEKRKRYLSGRVTTESTSARKNALELFLEKGFLRLFPHLGFVLPWVLTRMLQYDLRAYGNAGGTVVVVGHNCLRGLAFYWGHRYADIAEINMPDRLIPALESMRSMVSMRTLVLNVDHEVRRERIHRRAMNGEADAFDLYMAEHSVVSEHVEDILVHMAQHYLDAEVIENNDLSEQELREYIEGAFLKQG